MKMLLAMTVALSAGLCVPLLAAADGGSLSAEAVAAHQAAAAKISADKSQQSASWSASIRKLQDHGKNAAALNGVTAVDAATLPGLPIANPWRAYPPSCASYPLPDTPTNVIATTRMNLFARDSDGSNPGTETVTVTLWRIGCSSSGAITPYNNDGGANALTLLRIDRDAANNTNAARFPTFPQLLISQGAFNYNQPFANIRAAVEPNTFLSEAAFDSPLYASTTYALENYPQDDYLHLYNYAFGLEINPYTVDSDVTTFNVPGFTPTIANEPLAIDGYLSTSWYDPAHTGEGNQATIFESGPNVVFAATWYTYDELGLPFWLVAQATITAGATSISNVPVYYYSGGGFAGDFGPSATQYTWGTMNVTFPNCNEMDFDFSGQTASNVNGPSGSGSRSWQRVANINGLNCE